MRSLKHYLKLQWSRTCLVHNFLRGYFVCLLVFELLNLGHILQFTLQFTWRGLFITALIAVLILESIAYWYYLKKGFMLHWTVWIVIGSALALDAAADVFYLYQKIEWWDKATHFLNSAGICFGLFIVICAFWLDNFNFRLLRQHDRLHLSLLLSASLTIMLSVFYEIEEYTEDMIYKTNRLGPGTDTADDLLFNSLGVLLMVIILWLMLRRRKVPKLLT